MRVIRTAVVGMGYWGPKIARNIYLNPNFELVGVCDLNENLARESLEKFGAGSIPVFAKLADLVEQVNFEFVVIATPASTHYQLAHAAISFGKNVLYILRIPFSCFISITIIFLFLDLAMKPIIVFRFSFFISFLSI